MMAIGDHVLKPFAGPVSSHVRAEQVRGNDETLRQAHNSLTTELSALLAEQQPAIADPSGGTVQDSESRAAIVSILGALRAHGLIDT